LPGDLDRNSLRLGAALIGVVGINVPEFVRGVSDLVSVAKSSHIEVSGPSPDLGTATPGRELWGVCCSMCLLVLLWSPAAARSVYGGMK
jgi:hypothetical protein